MPSPSILSHVACTTACAPCADDMEGNTTSHHTKRCQWCPRAFAKTEHLKRHVRSHTKEKPYTCNICGKSYARRDTLLRHSRAHVEQNGADDALSGKDGGQDVRVPAWQGSIDQFDLALSTAAGSEQGRVASNTASTPSLTTFGRDVAPSVECSGNAHASLVPWSYPTDPVLPGSLEQDFDLDALNSTIFNMMDPHLCYEFEADALGWEDWAWSPGHRDARPAWFTSIERTANHGQITPGEPRQNETVTEGTNLDDTYRGSLRKHLRTARPSDSLPSTEFLNQCVHAYFSLFQPVFPLLHVATFRPSQQNALLLLSICSFGSLFLGGSEAREHGVRIFENLNKAILASWEWHLLRGDGEVLAMIQAATIGQCFALVSGDAKHLAVADSFHGTVIAWARRSKFFDLRQHRSPTQPLDEADLRKEWLEWVQEEERMRLVCGLHVLDGEISALLHQDPLLKHGADKVPRLTPEPLFGACSASQWNALRPSMATLAASNYDGRSWASSSRSSELEQSSFTAYTALQRISAAIPRAEGSTTTDPLASMQARNDLFTWCKTYKGLWVAPRRDPLQLRTLLCSTYLALLVSTDTLELALGREGPEEAEKASTQAKAWSESPIALRCLAYANTLLGEARNIRVCDEAAIHIPRATFQAGVVFCALVMFDPPSPTFEASSDLDRMLDDVFVPASERPHLTHFCRSETIRTKQVLFVDALRRVGRWGLGPRLATLLDHLVESEKVRVRMEQSRRQSTS